MAQKGPRDNTELSLCDTKDFIKYSIDDKMVTEIKPSNFSVICPT